MRYVSFLVICLLLLILFLFGVNINTSQQVPKQKAQAPSPRPSQPEKRILLGMWTEGLFDAKTQTLHPEALSEMEKLVQKKMAIAHYYRGWESLAESNLSQEFTTLRKNGWIPMLNVNPYFFSECEPTGEPLYAAIASGACDQFLRKSADNLQQIKEPFYFLFAWEMNNKDLEWSVSYSGGTPEDFIAAWRHVHTILSQNNKNIIWVFNPNTQDQTSISYDALYPGDAYVDWLGLDGYNWGTTQSWSEWSSFSGVFTSSYEHLVSLSPEKPVILAEVNTTDKGGNKGEWYTSMLTKEIPQNFPQIKAIVFYNEDRSEKEGVNWRIDVSEKSLSAFREAIHAKSY